MFYSVLEALPQTFSHFDSQRRNLFVRKDRDKSDELILVDWASCGFGPLGSEPSALVGFSAVFLEWPSAAVSQLDVAAFEGHARAGLGKAGWSE